MEDEKYMRRCIQLARNGLCNTAPNPMVGAVIVHNDRIIGEGYHVRCGQAHAEVNAIRSVKDPALLKESLCESGRKGHTEATRRRPRGGCGSTRRRMPTTDLPFHHLPHPQASLHHPEMGRIGRRLYRPTKNGR